MSVSLHEGIIPFHPRVIARSLKSDPNSALCIAPKIVISKEFRGAKHCAVKQEWVFWCHVCVANGGGQAKQQLRLLNRDDECSVRFYLVEKVFFTVNSTLFILKVFI